MTKKLNYKRLFIGVCVALIAILICTAFFAMPLKKASAEEQPPEITPFVSDIVEYIDPWNGMLKKTVSIFGYNVNLSVDMRDSIFADDLVFSYNGNGANAAVGLSVQFYSKKDGISMQIKGFDYAKSGSCILNSGKWDIYKAEVRIAFTFGNEVKEVVVYFGFRP